MIELNDWVGIVWVLGAHYIALAILVWATVKNKSSWLIGVLAVVYVLLINLVNILHALKAVTLK